MEMSAAAASKGANARVLRGANWFFMTLPK
jgi:hypothetical protein